MAIVARGCELEAYITFVVDAMFSLLETKNARNLMKALHERGEISDAEYSAWRKKKKKTV